MFNAEPLNVPSSYEKYFWGCIKKNKPLPDWFTSSIFWELNGKRLLDQAKTQNQEKTMKSSSVKENAFDGAPGGGAGSISYQPGAWGATAYSPEVSQNPDNFYSRFADKNKIEMDDKAINQMDNTRKDTPPGNASIEKDINAIYSKKDTPTPDDVATGLKYELGHMIKKDKFTAKQLVLQNLRKDPHFYSGLRMLNIDDETMMDNIKELLSPSNKNAKNLNKDIDIQVYNQLKEMKEFKVSDYIGLRLMQEQLSNSLLRLKEDGKINFDGITASLKTMNENKHPNDSPQKSKVTVDENATKKIFEDLVGERDKQFVVNSGIVDVMKEMWEAKRKRNAWKNGQGQ